MSDSRARLTVYTNAAAYRFNISKNEIFVLVHIINYKIKCSAAVVGTKMMN